MPPDSMLNSGSSRSIHPVAAQAVLRLVGRDRQPARSFDSLRTEAADDGYGLSLLVTFHHKAMLVIPLPNEAEHVFETFRDLTFRCASNTSADTMHIQGLRAPADGSTISRVRARDGNDVPYALLTPDTRQTLSDCGVSALRRYTTTVVAAS